MNASPQPFGEMFAESIGARPPVGAELRAEQRAADQIAADAGLPYPKVWVEEAQEPNAFAVCDTPYDAVIGLTTGLLDLLDPVEVRAVIAHEVGHVANGDSAARTRMMLRGAQQADALRGIHLASIVFTAFTESLLDDYAALLLFPVRRMHRSRQASKLQNWSWAAEYRADGHANGQALGPWLRSALHKMEMTAERQLPDELPNWSSIVQFHHLDLETHPPATSRMQMLLKSGGHVRPYHPCLHCLAPNHGSEGPCQQCGYDLEALFCTSCGNRQWKDHVWCTACGHRVAPRCRACGLADRGGPFCSGCGSAMP